MNIYLHLIFIFYLLLNTVTTIQTQAAQCPANELYYSVPSPMCDVNWQNLQRRCPLTSIRPVAGCYCRPNYARNLQQICIPRRQCVRDCDSNELPISPSLTGCEEICRTSPRDLHLSVCYRITERRCICPAQFCRNQRGQCVRNI